AAIAGKQEGKGRLPGSPKADLGRLAWAGHCSQSEGPPNTRVTVSIFAHSSSDSTISRACSMSLPSANTPWFLITTALVPFPNSSDTALASWVEPEGLFAIILGSPTTIFASSMMCLNFEEIETPIVKGL